MAGLGRMLAEGAKDFAAGVYKGIDGGQQITKQVNKRAKTQFGKMGQSFINSAPMAGISGTAGDFMRAPKGQRSIMQSIGAGHMKKVNGQDVLDMKKVAGTAATIGVAGRVATGGGLYRDRYGNMNMPGVPFI